MQEQPCRSGAVNMAASTDAHVLPSREIQMGGKKRLRCEVAVFLNM